MADIATLGLAIDSRQVVQGAGALDKFSVSAGSAQKAVTALEKVTTDAGKSTSALSNAAKPANDALANVTKNAGLSRNGLLNLSRQLQDVAVSVQGGMPIFTVLAQQGSQIYDVFASEKTATVGGALKQITSGILGAITPLRAFGVVGLATGAIGAAFYTNWHKVTLALDDTARSVGATTGELSKLQAVASFKGIASDDFTKGMQSFGRSVYDARAEMGGLAEVLRVNNRRAGDFNSSLNTAADLIKNARDDQQRLVLLQQMGLPATMQWVRLLSGGADGLKKAKEAAAEFAANDNLVASARRFDEAWNRTWTNFGLNARSAFQKAMEFGGGFLDRMERLAAHAGNASIWTSLLPKDHAETAAKWGVTPLSSFEQRFNASGANPATSNTTLADALRARADSIRNGNTIDPAAVQRALSLEQQRLGILGQVATVNETVRAQELAIQQARLSGVNVSAADAKRILDNAKANALGTAQIRAQTDAYNVENATLGMTTGSALAYASVQQRINEERRKGNNLTTDQIAALRTEANALGDAAQRAENMRFAYDGLHNSSQTFLSNLRSGASVWDSFRAAGSSALDAISSKLMKMATDQLWISAFGGSGGGLFGGLGSLFGGGNSSDGALPLPGNPSFIGPTFANGGYTGAGGKYEPAGIVHKGEYVIDAASTRRIGVSNLNRLRGYADGGLVDDVSPLMAARIASPVAGSTAAAATPQDLNVKVEISVANDGKLQAYVKGVSQQTTAGYVRSKDFVNDVGAASRKAIGQRK